MTSTLQDLRPIKSEMFWPVVFRFVQAAGITEVATDGKRFLTGRKGKSIHYVNDGTTAIWRLLEEPTSVEDAVGILCLAFPDQAHEKIAQDVIGTFKSFAQNGLLQPSGARRNSEGQEADLPAS